MKKSLMLISLLVLSAATGYAKSESGYGTLKFGGKLKVHGMNFLTVSQKNDMFLVRPIPSWGFFGEYGISDIIGLQASLEYSAQGNKLYHNRANREKKHFEDKNVNINYCMLTMICRFYLEEERKFCVFIGPRLSYLVSANAITFHDGKKTELKGPPFKRFDWGMLLGLDYEFDNGILFGFDTNIGFSEIAKKKTRHRERTFSFGFTGGYNFAKLF